MARKKAAKRAPKKAAAKRGSTKAATSKRRPEKSQPSRPARKDRKPGASGARTQGGIVFDILGVILPAGSNQLNPAHTGSPYPTTCVKWETTGDTPDAVLARIYHPDNLPGTIPNTPSGATALDNDAGNCWCNEVSVDGNVLNQSPGDERYLVVWEQFGGTYDKYGPTMFYVVDVDVLAAMCECT